MAVPKRKTSKSRRDKRRATHAISAPKVNVCPTCGQPKRPHRVCPTCGTTRAARSSRSAPTLRRVPTMSRIAVDAMGGDRGPEAVVEGALAARADGIEPVIFGSAGPRHARPRARPDDAGRRHGREARRRVPHEGRQLPRPRRQGRRRRRGRRGRVRRQHGSDARRGPRPAAACPRRAPPGDRRAHPRSQRPVGPDRRRRERRLPRRAPAPVRDDGSGLRRGDPRHRPAERAPPLDRRGAGEGEPAHARGARAARRLRPRLPRQRRGPRHPRGRRRRPRHRRLHRQRRAQGGRGDDPHPARLAARGDHREHDGNRSAGCSSVRPRGGCASGSTPTRTAARTSSACAGSS